MSAQRRTEMSIPIATLRAEYHQTPTPKLLCFHVIVNGRAIAVLKPEEVKTALARLDGVGNVG